MTAKARFIRGNWYVMIDYRGWRKSKQMPSEARAIEVAAKLTTAIDLYGFDAIKAFQSRREPAVPKIPMLKRQAERWLAEIDRGELKRKTRESYHYHVERHIDPKLGTLDLDEITYTVLKDWVLELSDKYSRNTVRLVLATLRLILEEAVREKLIASNPVSKLGRFARGAKRKKQTDPFALEQLHRVEATCHEQFPAYFAFVVTMARTGMRIGEAIALQGQDLDFERKVILIRRNMPDHREIETPKTESSSRVVDMSEQLVAVLRKHEVEQKARWLKRGNSRLPKWVFSTDQRTPIHYQNFRKRIWVELLKKAKVRYRSPHELRHTYASLMLSKGEDLAYVSGQLGHKNPSITLQIYTHAIPGHRRLSAEVLDWSGRRLTQMEAFSGEVVQGEDRA